MAYLSTVALRLRRMAFCSRVRRRRVSAAAQAPKSDPAAGDRPAVDRAGAPVKAAAAKTETSKTDAPRPVDPKKLAQSVTIYRDDYGVPHIDGPTDESVVFGFAYAQAEDYFWQVEDTYILCLGRYGEVLRRQGAEFRSAQPRVRNLPDLAGRLSRSSSPRCRRCARPSSPV